MDSTTTTSTVAAATARPLTAGEIAFNMFMFGLGGFVTAAFVFYLVTDPTRLSDAWHWVRGLPLVVQLTMWALLLPWMSALWVWSLPWAFAVRLVLVAGILLFTNYLLFPWKP
jgi:hypothetical protein